MEGYCDYMRILYTYVYCQQSKMKVMFYEKKNEGVISRGFLGIKEAVLYFFHDPLDNGFAP